MKPTAFSVAPNGAVRSVRSPRPVTSDYTCCTCCGRARLTTDPTCICDGEPGGTYLYGQKVSRVYGVTPFEARISRVGWGPLVAPDPDTEPITREETEEAERRWVWTPERLSRVLMVLVPLFVAIGILCQVFPGLRGH